MINTSCLTGLFTSSSYDITHISVCATVQLTFNYCTMSLNNLYNRFKLNSIMRDPLQAEERKTAICYISLCLLECVKDGCLIPWMKFSRIRSWLSAGSESHCDMHNSPPRVRIRPYHCSARKWGSACSTRPFRVLFLVDETALDDVLLSPVRQCFIPGIFYTHSSSTVIPKLEYAYP
jgi:hypothetical protein